MPETHYLPAVASYGGRRGHKARVMLEGWSADPAEVTCPVCLERLNGPAGVPPGQTPGL